MASAAKLRQWGAFGAVAVYESAREASQMHTKAALARAQAKARRATANARAAYTRRKKLECDTDIEQYTARIAAIPVKGDADVHSLRWDDWDFRKTRDISDIVDYAHAALEFLSDVNCYDKHTLWLGLRDVVRGVDRNDLDTAHTGFLQLHATVQNAIFD